MSHREILGASEEAFASLEDRLRTATFRGREYRHLPDYHREFDRGLVLIGDTVVRGWPKIPRTLVLREGIPRQFDGDVVIEEKLNGYNVRVAAVPSADGPDAADGSSGGDAAGSDARDDAGSEGDAGDDDLVGRDLLAFIRGGTICPFTTALVRDRLDRSLFAEHPGCLLCGEVIGPETPYIAHEYPGVDSAAFRAFDVRDRETGTPLPVDERRAFLADYDVPQVPHHGRVPLDEAAESVHAVIEALEADGREGVVMKSPDASTFLKYTTGWANRDDLRYAFSLPFDRGRDFTFRRLVREAYQSIERGEDAEAARERARAIGEAILEPMLDCIETVATGDPVGERHTVRAPPAVVDELLAHFDAQGLHLQVESDRREGDERVVTFLKVSRKSTDTAELYLDGHVVQE